MSSVTHSSELYATSIWEIQGKQQPLYLAGSVHLLKATDEIPETYNRVYQNSDLLVFEVEPDQLEKPQILGLMLKEGACAPGKTIGDYIGPSIKKRLEQRLSEKQIPFMMVQSFKPWMAAMTLTMLELQKMGARADLGVDRQYFDRARRDGKQTMSLETAEFQAKLLSSFSPKEQEKFLIYTLDYLGETEVMYQQIVKAWQDGDEDTLSDFFSDSEAEYQGVYERLLFKRNRDWIKPIEKLLQGNQTAMVVVGVGHLVGDGSVIDLLKRRGYNYKKLSDL
ncbi:MAG: TraB/GumN family protein [Verrucomicrobiota bacterium]